MASSLRNPASVELPELSRSERRRVGLLIESSRAYGRGLLLGISKYVRERHGWSVRFQEWKWTDGPPAWLEHWKGDGIIARIETRRLGLALRQLSIPVVDVRGSVPDLGFPLLDTDDREVAHLAADHLLERGFRQCGYCGFVGANYSDKRSRWFQQAVVQGRGRCSIYSPPQPATHAQTIEHEKRGLLHEEHLMRWLVELPKPVGIMACNDIRGQQVLAACRRAGLLVPDEVAVVGVDNDEVLCELSDPPLTSVVPNTARIGYEAAGLLQKLMSGEATPPRPRLISPLGIATRLSTDVLAIPDRAIAAVLRNIREHACSGIRVSALLKVAALSRTVFERRFTRLVGRSPKAEILRVQLGRARQLLADTDLPLPQIAERCGFRHPEYFNAIFRLKVGIPPGRYRAEHR